MRKKPIVAAIAVLAIILVAASSIAYFNSKDTADNVFTVGKVDIELQESWNPDVHHIIAPNEEYTKDPKVMNYGGNDAWVRIHVSIPNSAAIADAFGITDVNELDVLFKDTLNTEKWKSAGDPVTTDDTTTFTYVYNSILPASDGATEPIFESVKFPGSTDMEKVMALKGDGLEVNISADAIQAEGFDNVEEAFQAFDNQ